MAISTGSKITVSDITTAFDNKLSLSGGELTGNLTARTYSNIKSPYIDVTEIPSEVKYGGGYVAYDKNNNTMFGLSFAQWSNGTNVLNIGVGGKSGTENTYLSFREDTNNHSILMFDEKHIVRSVNGVSADVAGNVDLIYINGAESGSLKLPSGGTWRYRFSAKTANGMLYSDGIGISAGGTTIWTAGGSTTSAVVVAVKTA